MILLLMCLAIKKLNPIVTELFIRGRKLNYFIMNTPNNRELQQIAFNHSSDIDLYKSLSVLQNNIFFSLVSDNALPFKKSLLERK